MAGMALIQLLALKKIVDQTIQLAKTDYNLKAKYVFRNITIIKKYKDNLPHLLCEESLLILVV